MQSAHAPSLPPNKFVLTISFVIRPPAPISFQPSKVRHHISRTGGCKKLLLSVEAEVGLAQTSGEERVALFYRMNTHQQMRNLLAQQHRTLSDYRQPLRNRLARMIDQREKKLSEGNEGQLKREEMSAT